jgi:hypothetical protein
VKGDTLIFERGEHVYLVAPVAPFDPGENELDELAFAEDLKKMAPNENIGWLRGQYVEAERANENGAMWSSEELAIKSLTPMFMPVTVMHDPRSAVGLIADTKLLTRDQHNVPRARIDTTLGIWRHRFPGVWDEVASNYESGTLMQSMECLPRWYECGDCGRRYPKLPGGAEKANWCAHLRGEENAKATRRLGNVTFTGTGLIFGTRGARGALDSAHLEVFQDEVAEFHERVHSGRRSVRRTSTVDTIEIKRSEYDELKTAAARVPDLEKKVSTLEESAGKVTDLERKVEETETAKVAAEKERGELKTKVQEHEETARAGELAKDRLGKLGKDFKAKLGDFAKQRLEEQAGKLSDEEWADRLKELEELAGVKPDAGGASTDEDETTFSREETARANLGGGNGGSGEVSPAARKSVVTGLFGPKA